MSRYTTPDGRFSLRRQDCLYLTWDLTYSVCTVAVRLQAACQDIVSVPLFTPASLNLTFLTYYALEMTMGMGFPMGMGIPWDSHGNGNWWQNWEWEWEGMGNNHGNGNGHYSHWNQFPSADTVLSLCNSTVYCKLIMVIGYYVTLTENNICDFLRKSKIKTYNNSQLLFFWFLYYKNAHMILLASVAYLGLSLP